MEYNNYGNGEFNNTYPQQRNSFGIASMVCGICSLLVSCCLGPIAIAMGALSILFALLPYRRGEKRDSMSTTGILLSCVGMVFGFLVSIMVLVSVITSFDDPAFRKDFDNAFETLYGQDFEEYMENNFDIDIE